MAVQPQTPYTEYTANGVTTVFPLGFDCEKKDYLIVMIDDVEVDFTAWSLINSQVVFSAAPAADGKITFQRNTPFERVRDYQSYDNSFRPVPVNKDFDRIWWKLQELGVADWILGSRIDALKKYVDRKDDELKAYLLEEIRKQGVALDQLDEYYHYLMERLAQIAVDGGWDASFVVDGTQTQKEINLYGGKKYDMPFSGYDIGQIVVLDSGDRVMSTITGNTNNPNVDMTGWINPWGNQEVFNKSLVARVEVLEDRVLFLDEFNPAYSNAPLSTRFSTLTEAQKVYPAAESLTQTIDAAAMQTAINMANGRALVLRGGAPVHLSVSEKPMPDGQAGKYCIYAQNPVEIKSDGQVKPVIVVPANQHGIIGKANDISICGIHFKSDGGVVGTIGHHVKFFDCYRPKVRGCSFEGVSDAAINFGLNLATVSLAENWDNPNYDMFATGCKDIDAYGNTIYDCRGDAAIEIMAAVGGSVEKNNFYNRYGHGVRCVGNKDLTIERNYGRLLGYYSDAFSALISAFSGAITRYGVAKPLYNDNCTIRLNEGNNVKDMIHLGIGAVNMHVYDNFGTYRNRGFYLLHSGDEIGRWGLKDSVITRNRFTRPKDLEGLPAQNYGLQIDRQIDPENIPPIGTKILDNVDFHDNTIEYYNYGAATTNQTSDYELLNSNIRKNKFISVATSAADNLPAISLDYVNGGDFSGNEDNLKSGKNLIINNPLNNPTYGRRQQVKFSRVGGANDLISDTRVDYKTGQLVTLTTTGALPAPLAVNTPYYLIFINTKTVRLATSLANAFSGTAVVLTGDGNFHHYMTFI